MKNVVIKLFGSDNAGKNIIMRLFNDDAYKDILDISSINPSRKLPKMGRLIDNNGLRKYYGLSIKEVFLLLKQEKKLVDTGDRGMCEEHIINLNIIRNATKPFTMCKIYHDQGYNLTEFIEPQIEKVISIKRNPIYAFMATLYIYIIEEYSGDFSDKNINDCAIEFMKDYFYVNTYINNLDGIIIDFSDLLNTPYIVKKRICEHTEMPYIKTNIISKKYNENFLISEMNRYIIPLIDSGIYDKCLRIISNVIPENI
jgi:hypothetical protein